MKIFNNKNLTKKELRLLFCILAKEQGVSKVIFSKFGKDVGGSYSAHKKTIFIDTKETKVDSLRIMFHELAHHVATKRNLWKEYHFDLVNNLSWEEIFDIENGIDRLGEKLWNKYVDISQWGRYKYGYPKSRKKIIIETFISKR